MRLAIDLLLWFSAIAAALMAGIYFAFSTFVMVALGSIEAAAGHAAMNAINRVILRSIFMPLFLASTLAGLALLVASAFRWSEAGAAAMAAGGAVYVLGMTGVTMVCNVPLNNRLDRIDPATEAGREIWSDFLTRWTRWNHVRTVASLAALVLFVVAITARRAI